MRSATHGPFSPRRPTKGQRLDLHHVRQEALAAWPAIRGVLAGWLKSRSLSHQVAAVDRLLKAMTLGMAWQPAQQQRFMLVIHLAEPSRGSIQIPIGGKAQLPQVGQTTEARPGAESETVALHFGQAAALTIPGSEAPEA